MYTKSINIPQIQKHEDFKNTQNTNNQNIKIQNNTKYTNTGVYTIIPKCTIRTMILYICILIGQRILTSQKYPRIYTEIEDIFNKLTIKNPTQHQK